jgi:prepilin-type N-terminal cleavage/methylation domain-containing protein
MPTLRKATIANRRSRSGFTLIEMGVVIGLIALFAAMVMPSIAHWRAGNDYRAFPGKLLRFVAKAKQDAIDNKQQRSIGYDATTGELRMFWTDPQSQEEQEGGRLALPAEMEMGRVTYQGNDTAVQNWQLTFYQDGTADDAGCEIRAQDQYVTITTDRLGQIKMTRDQLPEQSDVRWSAGENEVRTQ